MFVSRITGQALGDGPTMLAGGRWRAMVPLVDSASGTAWLASHEQGGMTSLAVVKVCSPRFADYLAPAAATLADHANRDVSAESDVPGLPALVDVIDDGESFCLVYDASHGEPLDQFLPSYPEGLPRDVARRAIARLAAALAALHAHGVMHLDIRPATIAMDADGASVGLFDWGHAVPLPLVAGGAGRLPGFDAQGVQYASVELLTGRAPHPADDVFAFGCVAYEMLTGQHPFGRRNASEADNLGLVAAPIEGLSRAEQSVLRRALSIPGTRRDVSMAQIAQAFGASTERPIADSPERWGRRAVVVATVLAVVAVAGWASMRLGVVPGAALSGDAPTHSSAR